MRARYVVGILILVAAVPLQVYLMKYNRDFRNLVLEIAEKLPEPLQGLSVDFTDYVRTASKFGRLTSKGWAVSSEFSSL